MCKFVVPFALVLALDAGCSDSQQVNGPEKIAGREESNRVFEVKGVVKELEPGGKTVAIRHEEVPNYMPAMTMSFKAKDPKELNGLKAGDAVSFRMTVTADDAWIDGIRRIDAPRPAGANQIAGVSATNELPTN